MDLKPRRKAFNKNLILRVRVSFLYQIRFLNQQLWTSVRDLLEIVLYDVSELTSQFIDLLYFVQRYEDYHNPSDQQ